MRKGVGERRRGAGEWVSVPPVHPLCYGTAFLRLTPSFQHRSSKSCIQRLHTVKVGWTGTGTLLPSLALPPLFSFPPVSLYPVHSLSETPLNRHRNVYVKLTPQNHPNFLVPSLDGLQKFQFIFYILKMCILFGIGIRTIFQNSELLNLANFCEKS